MHERILVLRLSSLGDVVLTSSFLQSVLQHFPGARIDFVVREDLACIAGSLPGVARVLAVPRRAGIGALASMAMHLARQRYTHVFDVHQSLRSRLLSLGLLRRLRHGFSKQTLPRFVLIHLHRDIYERFGGAASLRERMLRPLQRLGFEPQLHATRLAPPQSARQRAAELLRESELHSADEIIAVVPGARWPSKCWPAERYGELVSRLSQDRKRRFVLLGAASEQALCATVAVANRESCSDFCGRLDLLESAAVLERCRLVITNDSGLLHVAEAVGRPVLALFGPTSTQFGYTPHRRDSRWLHKPPACSPCSKNGQRPCRRPTHECMENIGVDDVLAAVHAILAESQALASRR